MTTNLHTLGLSEEDLGTAVRYIGSPYREPDLIIAPDGNPYLYRWHVVPRNKDANIYLHVQVAHDPERPLHDHPWDNTSVILSGGYNEIIQPAPPYGMAYKAVREKGEVIHRAAKTAHRLLLPDGVPYTMTLFSTGPTVRDWGFWCAMPFSIKPGAVQWKWYSADDVVAFDAHGQSVWKGVPEDA